MDTKEILFRVLEIINFTDDKESFIDQFLSICVRQSITQSLDALPKSERDRFTEEVKTITDQTQIRSTLQRYISQEKINEMLQLASKKLFEDYIETILPKLTLEKKTQLLDFLKSIA